MTRRVSYLVPVSGISLDESGGTWIQAMPVGTYQHPVYGDLSFTHQRLQNFAASVNNRIRKIDPDIDYDHKARVDHAAGWVKNAEVRDNGLWLYVTWTPTAQQKLRDGEYRYFSPEFQDEWTDPSTGVTYQDVLFGGGLTNRPFLKDLVPINLSEMVGDTMGNDNTGAGGSPPTDAENMTAMARALGLSGQVTSAHIAAALATRLSEGANANNNGGNQNSNNGGNGQQQNTGQPQNITLNVPTQQQGQNNNQQQGQPQQIVLSVQPVQDQQSQNNNQQQQGQNGGGNGGSGGTGNSGTQQVALADLLAPIALTDAITGDPVALADVVRRQNEQIQMLASATKLADAQSKVIQLCEGSNIALSPAVKDLAIELMVKAPVQLSEKVEELLEAVAHGKATVVLGELGRSGAGSGGVIKQFSDAIEKARKESDGKLGYAEAMDLVSRTQPGLANAYRDATMLGEGGPR